MQKCGFHLQNKTRTWTHINTFQQGTIKQIIVINDQSSVPKHTASLALTAAHN